MAVRTTVGTAVGTGIGTGVGAGIGTAVGAGLGTGVGVDDGDKKQTEMYCTAEQDDPHSPETVTAPSRTSVLE